MRHFNPLNDYLFLKLMGEEGDEEQCLAFLNAVLGSKSIKPVNLIKILENRSFTAEIIGDKTSILDVRVESDIGEKYNIEVQLKDMHNMEKRTLRHWGLEYTKVISSGEDYADMPRVVTINIVNFDYIELEDYHTCFHLWEDDHKDYVLTDVLEIHFINMTKFRKVKNKDIVNKPLERWLTYFDKNTKEEEIEELIKMDKAISKTQERFDFVIQDKEFLHAYDMREMAKSDLTSVVNTALRKGKSEGYLEIAKNLKRMGLPVAQIAEGTGLDIKTIESLRYDE
jgi:predicted transposase/invertase (TIGR01784 family)